MDVLMNRLKYLADQNEQKKHPRGLVRRVAVICVVVLAALWPKYPLLAQGGTWAVKAPMAPRSRLAAGVVNGSLYAVGGFVRPDVGLENWVQGYDPKSNAWTAKAPLPTNRCCMAAGVVGGILYVAGGGDSSGFLATVEAYDPKIDIWTAKAPMPSGRGAGLAGVANGILYVVGGVDRNGDENFSLEAYDPKADTWTSKAPIPTPGGAAAAVIDGTLYVVGVGPAYNGLEAYDPKTDTWTAKAPMPTGRPALAAGAIDGLLYAVGGATGPYWRDGLATVEAYNPKTDSWTIEPPMPTPRKALAVGVIDDVLYAVGGENDDASPAFIGVNEAFSPFLGVSIDIKPGDPNNIINLRSAGVVPVAILGSATFAATTVDPTTVTFAGAPVVRRPTDNGTPMTSVADVNGDGYLDLLLYFRIRSLKLTPADTEAVLYGKTYSGEAIRGSDSVKVINPGRLGGPRGRPRLRSIP